MPRFLDQERILIHHMTVEWASEFELIRSNIFYPELRKLEEAGLVESKEIHLDWLWRITEAGAVEKRRLKRRSRIHRKRLSVAPPPKKPAPGQGSKFSSSSSSSWQAPPPLSVAI